MSDPLENLRKLNKIIQSKAQSLGLDVTSLTMTASPEDGGKDFVQVVFSVTPEALKSESEKEQDKIDADFEKMMSGVEIEDETLPDHLQEKVDKIKGVDLKKNIQDWLDG